mmetsp:Transcript_79951/g.221061  ORF Transcript_79951/g.221061 Transcript_79951/m.221061 type:complete len:262 (+) Transcript_79951:825-1610(+)
MDRGLSAAVPSVLQTHVRPRAPLRQYHRTLKREPPRAADRSVGSTGPGRGCAAEHGGCALSAAATASAGDPATMVPQSCKKEPLPRASWRSPVQPGPLNSSPALNSSALRPPPLPAESEENAASTWAAQRGSSTPVGCRPSCARPSMSSCRLREPLRQTFSLLNASAGVNLCCKIAKRSLESNALTARSPNSSALRKTVARGNCSHGPCGRRLHARMSNHQRSRASTSVCCSERSRMSKPRPCWLVVQFTKRNSSSALSSW